MGCQSSNTRFFECNKIKFSLLSGKMLISLNIPRYTGGTYPVTFIFDTGAVLTQLSREMFERLGYKNLARIGVTSMSGMSGNPILMDVYELSKFKLAGSLEVINSQICVPQDPNETSSHLLAQSSLRGFHYHVDSLADFIYFEKHSGVVTPWAPWVPNYESGSKIPNMEQSGYFNEVHSTG